MASTAHDSTFHFSTDGLPPGQRLSKWQEVFDCSVSRRMLIPLSDEDPFNIRMKVRTMGRLAGDAADAAGVRVMRMTLTAGGVAERTQELLRDSNDDVILHIHETGRRVVSQLGREASANPGVGLLTSNADTSAIVLPEPARFASIGVPRKLMKALVPNLEEAFVRPLSPDTGVLRLLTNYLDILDDEHALKTPEVLRGGNPHP
jgi:hypothetical protein